MSTRRQFLGTAGVLTFAGTAPAVLRAAAADVTSDERILVVVEMAGGNDGLNTVIPADHDVYRKSRPKLAIAKSDILPIADDLGFHPAARGFADLLEAGQLSVIQGVGYPNPNRSHFESMDIWHTCQRKDESRTDGWLGRFLESTHDPSVTDPAALHLGADKQPFALTSRDIRVPSIRSLNEFRLHGSDSRTFRTAVRQLAEARRSQDNDLLNFVQSSTSSAIAASERVEAAGMSYRPAREYPDSGLAKKLETVAKLITSGLQTRIYYVQIDGFDTHAQQENAHAALLRQVSSSVATFVQDLTAHGLADRVLCLCFSEFGRRVKENASDGTDHGTAGPVFLAGTRVRPGLIGRHPNLNDLKDGDLQFHTDFRQVYATVLSQWLSCDVDRVLKGRYAPVAALKSA